MLSRLAFRLAGRLCAILLVLTIAVHAGAPVEATPLDWRSGSAFSADTVEVALAPARSQIAVRIAVPLPRAVVPVMAASSNRAAFLFPTVPTRPDSTGPPVREPASVRPAAPRAPPLT